MLKKTLGHLVRYSDFVTDQVIHLLCLLARKERVGFTLMEFQLLLVQNKVPVSEKSLGVMLKTMGDFKNLQDFLQDIIVKNVEY